jgi:hypothetical protein
MVTLENIQIKRKSFFITFLIFLGLQLVVYKLVARPILFWWFHLILSIILWLGISWICKNTRFIVSSYSFKSNPFPYFINLPSSLTNIHLLILPTMLLWGSILSVFFLFLPKDLLLKQLVIFTSTILLYILIFKLDYNVQSYSLLYQNVINLTIIFTIFLWYCLIFYFYLYFGWDKWVVMFSVLAVNSCISWQALLRKNISTLNLRAYMLIMALILCEITWAISFWPVVYLVGGLVLTCAFYVLWGLIQNKIDNTLNLKVILEYLSIALAILAVVLGTTKWIPYM